MQPKLSATASRLGMTTIAKECNELNSLDTNLFTETTTYDRL
jgi:hypothetical protein